MLSLGRNDVVEDGEGRELNITQGAAAAGCTAVNFSKHLSVMVKAGVVDCKQGEDRRQTIFYIPAARRQVPGVIDYGFCRIDFSKA